MGKRSNFDRRQDYATPRPALRPLIPFLIADGVETFAEPCAGVGNLVSLLENVYGFTCVYQGDIQAGSDAREEFSFNYPDVLITNPPWRRDWLHPLITHFTLFAPITWLLFDSDWAHTKQAAPFLNQCSHIVSVGRVKWIPGSKYTGKDNASWYCFRRSHRIGPHFYGYRDLVEDSEFRRHFINPDHQRGAAR
jgi:hypothetical protein